MHASTFLRAAAVSTAACWLLIGASSAGAQTSSAFSAGLIDSPPFVSDGVDTAAIQPSTGHSRFSVGQHGPSMDHLPAVRENVELVGKLAMSTPLEFRFDPATGQPDPTEPPVVPGQIADLAVYKGFAYLNSWSEPSCKRGGVFVVDISDPKAPRQVGFLPAAENTRHGEGAHVITIGAMDVLAVNNEPLPPPCDQAAHSAGGIDLWDVTNPRSPRALALGIGDTGGPGDLVGSEPTHHAHSTFLWKNDSGRAYAVLTDNMEFGTHDIDIFEITDPTAPKPIVDFNLRATFPVVTDGGALGNVMYHHDVVVKKIGDIWRMLVSYWDAGYVVLDVNDPASPKYIGDTSFDGPDPLTGWVPPEGNAHEAEFSHDNRYILAADEDFDTHRFITLINGQKFDFDVGIPVTPQSVPRDDLLPSPGDPIEGDTRFIGDGCVAASVPAPQAGETVAVAERGTCDFDLKAANASAAGYDAILIFNNVLGAAPRCDAVNLNMLFDDPNADIKALLIPRSIGFRIIDAYDPATYRCVQNDATSTPAPAPNRAGLPVRMSLEFDGWGYTHLYERSAGKMRHIGAFAIEEGLDERYATGFGDLTVHEFAADATENVAYSSYYAGGMRVFTFGDGGLTETGKFIDKGGNNFWGVEQFTLGGERYFAGSDRDFGLYIFRYTGPGAAQRPVCEDQVALVPYGTLTAIKLVCRDANGNPLTLAVASGPAHGTLGSIDQGAATVSYTPAAGYRGADAFTFTASDGAATSAPATVRIAVGPNPRGCNNAIDGTADRDFITGTSMSDRVRAGRGDDVVDAAAGGDCVFGQADADDLNGQGGRDELSGGGGADRLRGGRGGDRLTGGMGRDVILAARGRDRVSAADGRADAVNCGRGRDRVVADEFDSLTNCERISLR